MSILICELHFSIIGLSIIHRFVYIHFFSSWYLKVFIIPTYRNNSMHRLAPKIENWSVIHYIMTDYLSSNYIFYVSFDIMSADFLKICHSISHRFSSMLYLSVSYELFFILFQLWEDIKHWRTFIIMCFSISFHKKLLILTFSWGFHICESFI